MDFYDPRKSGARISHAARSTPNPVTMAAGIATLNALNAGGVARLDALGERLRGASRASWRRRGGGAR